MSDVKVTRRQFLVMAGGLTAAAALAGGISAASASASGQAGDVSRTTGRELKSIPTTCQLCQARCGLLAFLRHGRLVTLEGNPEHPNSKGRVCAKGQAAVNLVYNPDRLLYPMKRAGARGDGTYERISWGEALDEIASKLKALRAGGHPDQFIFQGGAMASPRFVSRFLDAFGTTSAFFFSQPSSDTNRRLALLSTWGSEDGIGDVARSKFILNFGSNPYEAHWYHVPLIQRLIEARVERSARLVTFDVRLSKTAGKSDEWFPVNPGTDGLVALSMASVIMEERLYDEAFLGRWSNYGAGDLAKHLAGYQPENTEGETGVAAADVRRVARDFATSKPATTLTGSGLTMRRNGLQNERCVLLLNAITGNIDVPGGFCLPRVYKLDEPDPVPPKPTAGAGSKGLPVSPHAVLSMVREGKLAAGVYMSYMFNPAYSSADQLAVAEILKDEKLIPYFVAVDILPSETAMLADLVLPDTTFLERWDLESTPSFNMVPFVSLRQPVVISPGESAPFHDVCIELGRRVGGGMERFSAFHSAPDYVRAVARGIPGLNDAGGFEYLKEHGVWYDAKANPAYRSFEKGGFGTPSGLLEIHSPDLEVKGSDALPTFRAVGSYGSAGKDDLFLVTFKWGVLTSSLGASKWLSEIVHDDVFLMNAATARARGIDNGDTVEVQSAVGTIKGKVRLTQGIHPRVVASPTGTGHWGLGRVARAQKFESDDADTKLVWWKVDRAGWHPNAIIPIAHDNIAQGQAWHDTVVSVKKIVSEV